MWNVPPQFVGEDSTHNNLQLLPRDTPCLGQNFFKWITYFGNDNTTLNEAMRELAKCSNSLAMQASYFNESHIKYS